jgi:thioredoxin domain-containing protein 3
MLIFPASKHQDILKLCEDFPKELLTYGFFNDDNQNSFELICKTSEKYEQLPNNEDDKIIMKVAKRTSHLALALTEMNPLYVSHNVVEGERECSEIFNEDFYASEDVIETDEEQ